MARAKTTKKRASKTLENTTTEEILKKETEEESQLAELPSKKRASKGKAKKDLANLEDLKDEEIIANKIETSEDITSKNGLDNKKDKLEKPSSRNNLKKKSRSKEDSQSNKDDLVEDKTDPIIQEVDYQERFEQPKESEFDKQLEQVENIKENLVQEEMEESKVVAEEPENKSSKKKKSSKNKKPAEYIEDDSSKTNPNNERLQKLEQLRKRMKESSTANKQDVFAEYQRKKTNPRLEAKIEKQRLEAERLQARLDAQENGIDYERTRFWEYSAEQVEKYEEKEREKAERANTGFSDHMQAAEKKYKRLVSKIKPNMALYNQQKNIPLPLEGEQSFGELALSSQLKEDNKSVQYIPIHPKPSDEAVDRLVKHVNDDIAKRSKFSKIRPIKEDEDVTYINDRNAHFNRKLNRAYDKVTKEIKDNLERGTAL